ncbi:MAG: O-glycosyl hydrolase [Acidobacteriaceae bacterium]|nr:O-glycosyl hydrolase [Acidobacteriaceae bacterium]
MTTQTWIARRFNRPSMTRSGLLALALIAFCACSNLLQAQVYNPRHLDLDKIMNEIKTPHSDLTLLIAHRGLHALADGSTPGVPENSIESIRQAAMAGLEAVEVDVKLTHDGIPVLSHDYTWGRETCITYQTISDGVPFNPFTAKGNANNDSRNPKVSDVDLSRMRWWFFDNTTLRDGISIANPPSLTNQGCSTTGHGYTGEYSPTLQDVLNYMRDHSIAMVLTLDIKDAATAKKAWDIVVQTVDYRGVGFAYSTLFKIPARNFTSPASYTNVFGTSAPRPALFPYYGTADIQPIKPNGSNFGSEGAMMDALHDMETVHPGWIVATEVDQKEDGGDHILSNLYNYAKIDYSRNVAMRVGNFSPFKDLDKPGDPQPALPKFFGNTGYCCDTLLDYRYNVPNTIGVDSDDPYVEVLAYDRDRPSDVEDRRGDHSWITGKGFDIITADDVKAWNSELGGMNKRNVCGWLSTDVTACRNFQPTDVAPLSSNSRTTPEEVPNTPGLSSSGNFSGPGEPTGNIPALSSSNSATFTVQGGGATFNVSQPNDSVATYTWTDGGSPSEMLTSASGTGLGYALSVVRPGTYSGAQPSTTITVNPGTTYQTIDGFGGAMTDSAASLILGSPNRDRIVNTLFSSGSGGAGLTIVRSPMGSSDMMASATDIHTYEDTPGNFSASAKVSDLRQISALQLAKGIVGSNFKVLGTPWSAPGWMKRGGSLLPAQCGTDQNELDIKNVSRYAGYFVNYVNAYTALGLTPWAVSMQNEPENCKTAMPTTLMSATTEVALARALKSGLGSSVKILGWDHNWNDPAFVNTLVSSGSIDAIGYHCYDGTHYSNQTTAVPTYMTECSGFTTSSANVAQNLGWEVANLLIGPLRYGARGSIYWSLVQDPNGNPHLGGSDACQTCRGMVTVNSDGSFQPTQDLFYWGQFSKFVPPGSVRIASNNSGNLSTVAFRKGNQNTVVVLNSGSSRADGGVAGSDERDLRGHIVQWDGDTAAQKTAWLVGSDGYRRWISDGSTFNCLKYDAGIQGPDVEAAGALDKYINLLNVWAVCGQGTMGTNSELEVGTYLKSTNGARLTLTAGGLTAVDANGKSNWAPSGAGANRLILQEDGNLVEYQGTNVIWASNTVGSGAIWLSIHDDASFTLYNKANAAVWSSPITSGWYVGKIVQWEGDTAAQKTAWMVGGDGSRRWIPDLATFNCLHDAGARNAISVTTSALNLLPNLNNVWATCGGSQIGVNGAVERGSYLSAGKNRLTLQDNGNLVLHHFEPGNDYSAWWTSTSSGVQLKLNPDGNLALYDANRTIIWSSGTDRSNPGYLILGTDSSLRLWDAGGNNVWSRDAAEVPQAPSAGYSFCAKEGSTCKFSGSATVMFGPPASSTTHGLAEYTSRSFTNTTSCSITAFTLDPAPKKVKACWYHLN